MSFMSYTDPSCFTSSWARLRLYTMLEKLDRNVCYCDTDSIVYVENEQTKAIVDQCIGDGLGEWTDELGGNHMDYTGVVHRQKITVTY